MIKHSKGPWTQQFGAFTPGYASTMRIFSGDKAIADVFYGETECYQNANLIAAAPDLLQASEEFISWFKTFEGEAVYSECLADCPQLKAILSAISKAKGVST